MNTRDHLLKLVSVLIFGLVFKQYVAPYLVSDERYLISKFLYNETYSDGKPYLWMLVPLDENSRGWESFNERKNCKLNIPFVELCMRSIVRKNKNLFNVCVVTDDDLVDIIPNWNYKMSELSSPVKERVRRLAQLKLLYYYGGLVVPPSFLCSKPLRSLYARSEASPFHVYCSSTDSIICSKKRNYELSQHMQNMEVYVKDMSNETDFLQIVKDSASKYMCELDNKEFGLKTKDGEKIHISELLGQSKIKFTDLIYGIYFPYKEILQSTKWGWFAKLTEAELNEDSLYISKFFREFEL
tara:strand:+ start:49 stop:942 length:894 start_codon:yes stop_codon:yes gene_type:complete